MEPYLKTLFKKGFLVFLMAAVFTSCITPRHTVEISDYILLPNGKEVLGHENGLTAFIFENNPRKMVFVQFVADKYGVGSYRDVKYNVDIDGRRYTVFVYENAELEKYFDVSDFMVRNAEPEMNIVGSTAKFLAVSVINDSNEDCLAENSLYKNTVAKYLKNLKDEYNNL
ncbi:MAG: hypothetical protein EOP55_18235 [Sphingobacteriales bacterium]|nr:MAG: hypothetical protein EOP55_18235 [Sphingobacteriales bacterium]